MAREKIEGLEVELQDQPDGKANPGWRDPFEEISA
jgi:hypothetical protein